MCGRAESHFLSNALLYNRSCSVLWMDSYVIASAVAETHFKSASKWVWGVWISLHQNWDLWSGAVIEFLPSVHPVQKSSLSLVIIYSHSCSKTVWLSSVEHKMYFFLTSLFNIMELNEGCYAFKIDPKHSESIIILVHPTYFKSF